jgi:hypothetical protein
VIIDIAPELESPELARRILDVCIEFWRPHHAHVGRDAVMRMSNQPPGDVRIGWLTYLTDPNAADYLPNDIRSERIQSGLLVKAAELPGHQSDIGSIEGMRGILDALGPHGFLMNPQRKSK